MFKLKKERINFKKKLGKGASGAVYAYQKDPDDLKWVVKRMHIGDSDELLSCLPEIVLGFSCDHPCIVPLKGYSIEKGDQEDYYIFLKFPRMRETLKDKFDQQQKSKDHFPEKEIVKYFYSLVCAVDYLHKKKIYHRDIKPGNILLNENGNAKLSDIGAAKHVIEEEMYQPLSGLGGTVDYTAPELLKERSNLTKESLIAGDAWSIGLVVLELCALKNRLFSPYSSRETIQETQNSLYSKLKEYYAKPLVEMISKLLNFDSNARIEISEVKKTLEEEYNCQLSSDLDGSQIESVETLRRKEKAMLENYKKSLQEMISSVGLLKEENMKVQNELKEYRSLIAQYQSQITSEISKIYTRSVEKLRAEYQDLAMKQIIANKYNPRVLSKFKIKIVCAEFGCSEKMRIGKTLMSQPFTDQTNPTLFPGNHIVTSTQPYGNKCFQIWEIPGQREYEGVIGNDLNRNLVMIAVYDVTSKDSFSNLLYWIEDQMKYKFTSFKKIIFVIGTKTDDSNRRVATEEAQAVALKYGALYTEVRAKIEIEIDQLREKIIDEIEKNFEMISAMAEKKKLNEEKKQSQNLVQPELKMKAVIVGSHPSSKFSLINSLTSQPLKDCTEKRLFDWHSYSLVRSQKEFKLSIYNIPSVEKLGPCFDYYFHDDLILIIVYSMMDKDSFLSVPYWIRYRMTRGLGENLKSIIFIVGTEADCSEKVVATKEAEAIAAEHGAFHIEVSSTTGMNIDQLREKIVDQIEKNFDEKNEKLSEEEINGHDKEKTSRSELETQDVVLPVDFNIKISVVGDGGSGKTNLILALTTSYPSEEDYNPDSSEVFFKSLGRHDKLFTAEIVHVNANEECESKLDTYLTGNSVLIVVYRMDSQESFSKVSYWIKASMRRTLGTEDKPIIFIVGTCLDCPDQRDVPKEEAEALALMHGAIHMEVSSKTRENIDEFRERIIDEIFKRFTVRAEKKEYSFWDLLFWSFKY